MSTDSCLYLFLLQTSKYYVNAFDEIAEEVGSAPLACLDDRDFNYSLDTGAAEEEQEVACIAAASPAPLTDSCGPTDQELMLTEQAAQCLELPHDLGDEEAGRKRRPKCSPKNTFYFYQGKCVSLSQSYGLNSMSYL